MKKRLVSIITVFIIGIIYVGLTLTPKSYAQTDNIENMIGKVVKEGDILGTENVYIALLKKGKNSSDDWEDYAYMNSNNEIIFGKSIDLDWCSISELEDNACYNDKSMLWTYILDISKYWKITNAFIDDYGTEAFYLEPYEYKKPSFELSCNPNKILKGGYSECILSKNYFSKFNNISFKLEVGNYEISNIKLGDSFENLQSDNNIYSVTGKDEMEVNEDGVKTDILKFRVTSLDNLEINDIDNIKIIDLKYSNDVEENSVELLTDTVKKDINNTKVGNNPKTSNVLILIFLSIIVILVLGTYLYKRRESMKI